MKTKILAAILFSLTFFSAYAETVSQSQAERAAQSFYKGIALTKASISTPQLVWNGSRTKSAADAPFYIFNFDDEGFVVIAGDDGMNPVLGYSTDGIFDPSDIPDGLNDLLENYRSTIDALRKKTIVPQKGVSQKWSKLLSATKAGIQATALVNLKTARWGQRLPYKRMCPKINDTVCVTGCGATALSILMKYYKWPDKGYGTLKSYVTGTWEYSVPEKELGYDYQWDNMLDKYNGVKATKTQKNAVATIMADAGQMIFSDYRPKETTSSFHKFLPGMLSYMKYSNKAAYKDRSTYSTEDWTGMLKAEMDAGHPVIYRGVSINGGHFYIIDGYDSENRFHFNWGWNGSSNGYFHISDTDFSYDESGIFGLVPDKNWTEPTTSTALSYYIGSTGSNPEGYFGIWADKAYISQEDSVTIYVDVINSGTTAYKGKVKICLRHSNGKVDDLDVSPVKFKGLKPNYIRRVGFNFASFPAIAEGDEVVSYYLVGSEWVPVDDGKKTLPLRYDISDVVSLEYRLKKKVRYLELTGMAGMTLAVGEGEAITFTIPKLILTNPTGAADYTINNGHDTFTVHLTFPEQ